MLRYPDVSVHAEHDVDFSAPVARVHGPYLSAGSDYPAAASCSADGEEDAVSQFAIFQTSGV